MDGQREKKRNLFLLLAAAAAVMAAGLLAAQPLLRLLKNPEAFRAWVEARGAMGAVIYVAVTALQIVLPVIPGEPFEIAAGYTFGTLRGLTLCMTAEAIGTVPVLFLVRRYGRRLAEVFFSKEKLDSVRFLQNSRAKLLLFSLIFLLPGTPKDLLCYYAGLTELPFGALVLVCCLGRFPAVMTSVLGGSALGTKEYLYAGIAFAGTALISLLGILIFSRLNRAEGK